MAPLPSGSYGRELRFTVLAPLIRVFLAFGVDQIFKAFRLEIFSSWKDRRLGKGCPPLAHPGRSAGPGSGRRWRSHQPPRSGATQKRGAHQPPENAPQCIRTREGVAYYSSPLTKKRAFACQAFWSEEKNSTTREGSRRVHKVHPTDFPVHSVQGPLRGGWFS